MPPPGVGASAQVYASVVKSSPGLRLPHPTAQALLLGESGLFSASPAQACALTSWVWVSVSGLLDVSSGLLVVSSAWIQTLPTSLPVWASSRCQSRLGVLLVGLLSSPGSQVPGSLLVVPPRFLLFPRC